MNWIELVVEQHKEFESPLNFWRWAAIASISATVKDNVWLDQHMFNMYPNIYVMFHADSGMKKGPPVNLAKKLVSKVGNTRVISGRSSIQGILKEMAQGESRAGQPVSKKAVAFICSSELSSSIVEDKVATTILTDLYDRNYNADQWKSLLKMEAFDLKDPTITMLTATNESHSNDFFSKKDISGGYFARTFIIHEHEENRTNSLMLAPRVKPDYDQLVEYLKELAKLNGPFVSPAQLEQSDYHTIKIKNQYDDHFGYYTPAGAVYEEWYREFAVAKKAIKDPTGTLNRFGSSVLKVAMLLSLAESTDLHITETAMATAIEMCERLVGNVRKVTLGKEGGEGTNTERKIILLQELLTAPNHKVTRGQLHKKYWMQGNVKEWDDCAVSFIEAQMIDIGQDGAMTFYQLKPEQVIELKKFFAGRSK